ncbi:uncharacterized protein AC631_05668 [Debaryomyces fabryi]|uniref:N-acetyltransferase domain-containing protein n=1 Tax=Debaryomyces fabryi TaxID=58627 RepID=A0A0V1PQP7_9ASCO|nr:uncharacterized protein AC631_05668 [Debaryomyces fabryi]KRZ98568.1 hypothetical protein AC631_05668 [Debaryomyces fabryi]CUM56796.1 unnamed protein product [Debaryomyces fabryi]
MNSNNTLNPTNDVQRLNEVMVSAFKNVGFIRFLTRRINELPPDVIQIDETYFTFQERIHEHLNQGAQIFESDDYNAVAIWYPPGVEVATNNRILEKALLQETLNQVTELSIKSKKFKRDYFKKQYWYLNTLARHMKKTPKKGSVSALIYPILESAKNNNKSVYVEAITSHARDIYFHLGFEVRESFTIGKGQIDSHGNDKENGEGIQVFLMVIDND